MTLEQALRIRKGDKLCSPHDVTPYHPRNVTEVWVSEDGKYVRMRIAAVSPNWIGTEMWTQCPDKPSYWDSRTSQWRDQNGTPFTPKLERDLEEAQL